MQLNLNNNYLTGPIPVAWTALTLNLLNIFGNQFICGSPAGNLQNALSLVGKLTSTMLGSACANASAPTPSQAPGMQRKGLYVGLVHGVHGASCVHAA